MKNIERMTPKGERKMKEVKNFDNNRKQEKPQRGKKYEAVA